VHWDKNQTPVTTSMTPPRHAKKSILFDRDPTRAGHRGYLKFREVRLREIARIKRLDKLPRHPNRTHAYRHGGSTASATLPTGCAGPEGHLVRKDIPVKIYHTMRSTQSARLAMHLSEWIFEFLPQPPAPAPQPQSSAGPDQIRIAKPASFNISVRIHIRNGTETEVQITSGYSFKLSNQLPNKTTISKQRENTVMVPA
jgi:hypothetical protein